MRLHRNDVIQSLQKLDDMSQHMPAMIPFQILMDIDNGRNPMQLTKERLDRASAENQFMNGRIRAVQVCFFPALPYRL